MSQVAINKSNDTETTSQALLEKLEAIQKRAFDIFQHRNGGDGSDLSECLQAEQDVVWPPASEAGVAWPGRGARHANSHAKDQ
jgi:hypothetical protein